MCVIIQTNPETTFHAKLHIADFKIIDKIDSRKYLNTLIPLFLITFKQEEMKMIPSWKCLNPGDS